MTIDSGRGTPANSREVVAIQLAVVLTVAPVRQSPQGEGLSGSRGAAATPASVSSGSAHFFPHLRMIHPSQPNPSMNQAMSLPPQRLPKMPPCLAMWLRRSFRVRPAGQRNSCLPPTSRPRILSLWSQIELDRLPGAYSRNGPDLPAEEIRFETHQMMVSGSTSGVSSRRSKSRTSSPIC